jgi:hypothetical protein
MAVARTKLWLLFKKIMVSAPKSRRKFLSRNKKMKIAFTAMYSSYIELLNSYTCPYCLKKCRRAMGLANHMIHRHYEEMRRDFEELVVRFFEG